MNDNNNLRSEVCRFKEILKQRGYFYDVGHLHDLFKYSQTYTPFDIKGYWARFVEEHENNTDEQINIDLYLHIPYCRSKCAYCLFPSWPLTDRKHLDFYINYLVEEMKFIHVIFKKIKFRNLYVGGGTPSILNDIQMKKVFSSLFKYFSFYKNTQKTCECNPYSINGAGTSLLKHFGFNRVSFGVQSLNPVVLQMHKRGYQEYIKISKAIMSAKKSGIKDINIDLILGLAGDDLTNFKKSFESIAKLKPYNIVVYGLMPPNKDYLSNYLKMSSKEYFMNHYRKIVPDALKIMRSLSHKFGYMPDSLDPARFHWGFRLKSHFDAKAAETYSGEHTGCTLGLGVFARSHIHGIMEYRQDKYIMPFNPDNTVFSGRINSPREEMIKFIINNIDRNSNIPQKDFYELFNVNVDRAFPYAIQALKKLNRIKFSGNNIYFLSNNPEDKFIYTLFFFR